MAKDDKNQQKVSPRHPEYRGGMFSTIGRGFMDSVSGKTSKERAQRAKEEQEAREAKAEKKREVRGIDSFDYVQEQSDKRKIRQDYKNPTDGDYKKGGSVSPSKKTLAKSGFYDKGTTKSEREKIVNKVTTKPQRVKMVEKMLSTRKSKRYAEGGLAGLADSANSLMGEVDSMANTINYGSSNASSVTEPLGFNAVSGFKKGGSVKSSASKRGDGIALRGKTRGKVV